MSYLDVELSEALEAGTALMKDLRAFLKVRAETAYSADRPFVLLKATVRKVPTVECPSVAARAGRGVTDCIWECSTGDIAGYGASPDAACRDFDRMFKDGRRSGEAR